MMVMERIRRCGTCRWWEFNDQRDRGTGQCQRNPPTVSAPPIPLMAEAQISTLPNKQGKRYRVDGVDLVGEVGRDHWLYLVGDDTDDPARWPTTRHTDFCGEWSKADDDADWVETSS